MLITLVSLGGLPFFSGMQKFAAPFVGPLFVGAPVRPNMLNMPKSVTDQDVKAGLNVIVIAVITTRSAIAERPRWRICQFWPKVKDDILQTI